MKFAKKSPVKWGKNKTTTEYDLTELIVMAVCDFFVWTLLMHAFTSGIEDVWSDLKIIEGDRTVIFLVRFLCAAVMGVGVSFLGTRLKGKLKKALRPAASLAGILVAAGIGFSGFFGNRATVISGFYGFLNRYAATFDERYGVINYFPEGSTSDFTVFFTLTIIVLTIFCWSLALLFNRKLFWILIPVAGYGMEMAVGQVPGWTSIGCFIVGTLFLIANTRSTRKTGTIRVRRRYREKFFATVRFKQGVVALCISIALIIIVTVAFSGAANRITGNGKTVQKFQKNIERTVLTAAEMLKKKNTTDLTDPVTDKPPVFRDETIANITTSDLVGENIYIREYIGSTYENGMWHYNPQTFEEACKAMDFESDNVRKQLENVIYSGISNSNSLETVTYTVEYSDYITTSALAMYFTDIEPGAWAINEDVLPQKKLFQTQLEVQGLKDTTLSASRVIALSEKAYPSVEEDILNWYDKYVLSNYVSGSASVPTAGDVASYMKTRNKYKDNANINRWRLKMAENVAVLLSSYTFNWAMDETPAGTDVMEYFLTKGHTGYNIHFATAGTLILQEMGIPARYVRGYVVNGEKFIKNEDGSRTTLMLDRDLHAWIEVYLNHVGWVPIETTPSYKIVDNTMKTGQEQKKLRDKPVLKLTADDPNLKPWQVGATISDEADPNTQADWSSLGSLPENNMNQRGDTPLETGPDQNYETDAHETDRDNTEQDTEQPEIAEPELEETEDPDDGSGADEVPDAKEFIGTNTPRENEQPDNGNDDGSALPENTISGDEIIKGILLGVAKIIGWIAALALLVLSIILIAGKCITAHYKSKIEAEYAGHNYGEVVRKINRRLYLILKFKGRILKMYPTDAEYLAALKETYAKTAPSKWDTFMEIAKEAQFSDKEISVEKADFCYDIYKKLN